ncbi:unnamed protein product, partial [Allacma fusca]
LLFNNQTKNITEFYLLNCTPHHFLEKSEIVISNTTVSGFTYWKNTRVIPCFFVAGTKCINLASIFLCRTKL